MSRRLVVRMDILPHIEMINMQKVGIFGSTYNKLVRIQDLEKVPYEELAEKGKKISFINIYIRFFLLCLFNEHFLSRKLFLANEQICC